MRMLVALAVLAASGFPAHAGVASSATEVHPALIGAAAPAPTLQNGAADDVEMGRLYGEQPTILVLYRGGW